VLFLNETASRWSGKENWAVGREQELRARLKEDAKDSNLTIHSNRLDVRVVNGALYPVSNITTLPKWGARMHSFDKIERMAKGEKIGRISHIRQA
jgi:hypothetical protein